MEIYLSVLLVCSVSFLVAADLERFARIIGGEEVTEQTLWPWLVSLEGKLPHESFPLITKKHTCGASLLDSNWILTAAHCFDGNDGLNPEHWTASFGTLKRSPGILDYMKHGIGWIFNKQNLRLWNFDIEKIIIHPEYKEFLRKHDIAVLKLKEPVPLDNEFLDVQKVKLPNQSDESFPVPGEKCVIQGWGCTNPREGPSSIARQVTLPIMEESECKESLIVDYRNQLCAGGFYKQKGTCPGDYGSPMICQHNGDLVQGGIASENLAMDNGNYPSMLTRVSYYIDWIETITADG